MNRSRVFLFNHTSVQARQQKKNLLASWDKVIGSGCFLEGQENQRLTRRLQQVLRAKYVVTVASGHDALLFAIQALQLQKNDEVIIPANAYPTAFPVFLSGAKLVLCDIDENGQLSYDALTKVINGNTRAVAMVHMYGLVGELAKIQILLKKCDIVLIEDCAQAFGSLYQGKPVGTFGDIACFSFYPTKNLGALGDGGALVTKKPAVAAFVKKAKMYGETERYASEFPSGHSRLPELQAAGLNTYLQAFPAVAKKRQELATYFWQKIAAAHLMPYVRALRSSASSSPTLHLCVIEVEQREALRRFLEKNGVQAAIHYPLAVHQVAAFAQQFRGTRFPLSEQLAQRALSLPFHQHLRKKDIDTIARLLQKFYAKQPRIQSLSVFFPAYNDQDSIASLVKKTMQLIPQITDDFEVIVVNDGSTDGTAKVLRALQKTHQHLRVVTHQHNRGYGGALISGLAAAKKEWIFYTDGDGQYDPTQFLLLIKSLAKTVNNGETADVVNGFREKREDPLVRKFLGASYNVFLHKLYDIPIRDLDCDFRLIRRAALHNIHLSATSGLICLELIHKLTKGGARFTETRVDHYPRKHGKSQFFAFSHLFQTFRDQVAYYIDFRRGTTPQNTRA
jgi:dTDP-4-amino-4,6-dideoxygalactose transaminase